MKNEEHQVTPEEAQATIKTLENIKRSAVLSSRPPLWLNMISSLLLGLFTVSIAWAGHENLWFLVTIFSMISFVSTFLIWFRHLYLKGIIPGFPPAFSIRTIAPNLFFLLWILGSRSLYKDGVIWAPYVGATIICMVYSLKWHYFPTHETLIQERAL